MASVAAVYGCRKFFDIDLLNVMLVPAAR